MTCKAWKTVQNHDLFRGIESEPPSSIDKGGGQRPFSQKDLDTICAEEDSYTCNINLAWIDWNYSATPGIPIRAGAVGQVVKQVFEKPKGVPQVEIAMPERDFKPLNHKGALKWVSPEEITSAFLMAVARDIKNSESNEILQEWKNYMLSTTARFMFLPRQMDRYWYAFDQREQLMDHHAFQMYHRSCFQRLHEIIRLSHRTNVPPLTMT